MASEWADKVPWHLSVVRGTKGKAPARVLRNRGEGA